VRRRIGMKSLVLVALVVLAACSSGAGRTSTSTTIPAGPSAPGPRTRKELPPLVARLVLKSHTVQAGSAMTGRVVLQNNTTHGLHATGCVRLFQVALHNATIHQDPTWLSCIQMFTIPPGRSVYPITVVASYLSCTPDHPTQSLPACLTNHQAPPLPPGQYRATLVQQNRLVPTPTAITVRVTARSPAT